MTRTLKAIIIGGVVCFLGLALLLTGYFQNNKSVDGLIPEDILLQKQPIARSYKLDKTSNISLVSINTANMPIEIQTHNEQYIQIDYFEHEEQKFDISNTGGKLFFKLSEGNMFEKIIKDLTARFLPSKKAEAIVLHIPKSYAGELILSSSNADILLPETLAFKHIHKLDIKTSGGDITCGSFSGNILNIRLQRGSLNCQDLLFSNMSFIISNSEADLDFIQADKLNIKSSGGSLYGKNIISQNIVLEADNSKIFLGIFDYSEAFSKSIEASSKTEINIAQYINPTLKKSILIKSTASSRIDILFQRDN